MRRYVLGLAVDTRSNSSQRHIDQEQDPDAKSRLERALAQADMAHIDSAFMYSMTISPLLLLGHAHIDNDQVPIETGLQVCGTQGGESSDIKVHDVPLQTALLQAGRQRPPLLLKVEYELLRQLLLMADGKQTVHKLLDHMQSALESMAPQLDAASSEDRAFFARMFNREESLTTLIA